MLRIEEFPDEDRAKILAFVERIQGYRPYEITFSKIIKNAPSRGW